MPLSVEDRVLGSELFFHKYLEGYRNRVSQYYLEKYEKHPSSFKLMGGTGLIVVHLLSDSFFFFFRSEAEDYVKSVVASEDQNEKYNSMIGAPDHIRLECLSEIGQIDSGSILSEKKLSNIGSNAWTYFRNINHVNLPNASYTWGGEAADLEYLFHNFNQSLIAHKAPKADFHLFDISQIVSKVNDEDFQYEYEEAIKAYNAGLYLPSTITTAVAIETLLKNVIIQRLGERKLPRESREKYILNYANILLREGVISERLNHRIRATNELRRSAGHSKSGKVEQWDAEQAISCVKVIVDELFTEVSIN